MFTNATLHLNHSTYQESDFCLSKAPLKGPTNPTSLERITSLFSSFISGSSSSQSSTKNTSVRNSRIDFLF